MNKSYGNESISSLKGPDRVRKRPGVIFGSDGLDGCTHSIFEILSNSIDEAREGHGDTISIKHTSDGFIEISDYGRGVPVEFNKAEDRFNWELVFCELYAGGKYKNNEGENYEFSLGLNGLGTCATQYSSAIMDVCVYRDGYQYNLHFEKGFNKTDSPDGFIKKKINSKKTGTTIKWLPDIDVFTDINIPDSYFLDVIKKQAIVNKALKFIFIDIENNTHHFCYNDGILDYVKELSQDSAITPPLYFEAERRGKDRADKAEYKLKITLAFCFGSKPALQYYHNSSFLEHGGSPDKATKSAFVSAIDSYIKQIGKYTKNESKITFVDVSDSLVLVTNCFSTYTSYENQTKKSINNKFITEAMTEFLKTTLEVYFIENKADADKIAEQILINKRSREQAEKARLNIKKKLSGNIDISNRVQKFVDCRTKNLDVREIYIVEGDSALGSCKQGRDAEFQAIIPVRGKILNCLKAQYDKIFKNEIITDLLKVLGCGVEVRSKASKDLSSFDISALRWNKIIICTDADVDGYQIRTLILTMLYRLVPTLIEQGFVYIAESPLYEISYKDKSYFAFTEKDKENILKKFQGKKILLQRSKGLGENEPKMMWETTMNPETRRLVKVIPQSAKETSDMFDMLLGENLAARKDYISKYGYKYLNNVDIS